MSTSLTDRVLRIEASDPVALGRAYDYADAFVLDLPAPDTQSPEGWVLTGMDDVPAVIEWITSLLGIADDPSADRPGGWTVVESNSEVVHLEQSLPLMYVTLVGRNAEANQRMLTTVVQYQRPTLARLVWAVVGIAHRRTARRVITNGITS